MRFFCGGSWIREKISKLFDTGFKNKVDICKLMLGYVFEIFLLVNVLYGKV